MGEAARVFGKGFCFRDGDTEYQVSPFVMEMFGLFESWLEDQAYEKVERRKGTIRQDLYLDRLDAVTRLVSANAFGWLGKAFQEAFDSEDGFRERFYLQLSRGCAGREPVTRPLADDLFDRHREMLMRRLAEQFQDPFASQGNGPMAANPSPCAPSPPASSAPTA